MITRTHLPIIGPRHMSLSIMLPRFGQTIHPFHSITSAIHTLNRTNNESIKQSRHYHYIKFHSPFIDVQEGGITKKWMCVDKITHVFNSCNTQPFLQGNATPFFSKFFFFVRRKWMTWHAVGTALWSLQPSKRESSHYDTWPCLSCIRSIPMYCSTQLMSTVFPFFVVVHSILHPCIIFKWLYVSNSRRLLMRGAVSFVPLFIHLASSRSLKLQSPYKPTTVCEIVCSSSMHAGLPPMR